PRYFIFILGYRDLVPTEMKPKVPARAKSHASLGARELATRGSPNVLVRFLRILGPGVIAGASDDDPSGIGTYSVAGASLGFSTLWTALITLPMMAAVQYIAARIGLVTGLGFGSILRRYYPAWVAIGIALALLVANTINAGADIGAIAAAVNLLAPRVSITALVIPIGAMLLAFQWWGSYRLLTSIFKWLALALFAYIAAAVLAHPNWQEVLLGTFVPRIRFDSSYLTTLVAILGTTISPYMLYWQASQEVEEDIALGRTSLRQRRGTTPRELRYAAIDIGIGMLFSNIVMYFIITATGATLYASGHHQIQTATDAARALAPLAGQWSQWLLALGLIGSGILAVPVMTISSAYALAGALGWKEGLNFDPTRAPHFYAIIAGSTLVGMEINFSGLGTIAALFWSAVINGLLAPIVLFVLMLVANNRKIMAENVNGWLLNVLGWTTTVIMAVAAILLVVYANGG
ncbi:MAG TPA: divalent metal cation transporter, partial [Candidatus Acidoferrales bacterium]|nr:divalent metal cation transporter [Candidatus Acidoferrales bacterium]